MLVSFSVRNYGPFRDETTLSMQCTNGTELPCNVLRCDSIEDGILATAAVFGPNASGKSYLLKGLKVLKRTVKNTKAKREEIYGYEPFRLSEETLKAPCELRLTLALSEGIFEYYLAFNSKEIVKEHLLDVTVKDKVVFTRDTDRIETPGCVDVRDKTTTTSAYLTVASQFNDDLCNRIYDSIMNIDYIDWDEPNDRIMTSYRYFEEHEEVKDTVLDGLKAADFNISNIRGETNTHFMELLKKEMISLKIDETMIQPPLDLYLTHNFTDVPARLQEFPMEIESNGTKNMFGIIGPIARALKDGRTVIIDEFGSSLHPVLTRWILGLFKSEFNTNNAQLIVNTHDLSLMDIQNILRRDQIYFVNRDRKTGKSELYSLSDFKGVRKDSNVLKDYLFGRFDAVPNVVALRRRWA